MVGKLQSTFQSLKGISDYYNGKLLEEYKLAKSFNPWKGLATIITGYTVDQDDPFKIMFQSLKGISDYYNKKENQK